VLEDERFELGSVCARKFVHLGIILVELESGHAADVARLGCFLESYKK
jgi:hypothetical protein